MREENCTYKDEIYYVRDNGQVLRHPRIGKKPRPTDNKWTFGKPNEKSGYMEIGGVGVHRIVATAFYGEAPTEQHIADHIDTNRKNNRPENLRWITKLENILLNPITVKRIKIVCGSVEAFLADPSKFRSNFPEPNYSWMCAVSEKEAQLSLERLLAWAKSDKHPSHGHLGEWIFNRSTKESQEIELVPSKTSNALQRNWKTSSEFLCCPENYIENPIATYSQKLKPGSIFCRNNYYSSLVFKRGISNDGQSLFVMSESKDSVKPWSLAKITFENELYVHEIMGTFFVQNGVEKQFCFELGLVWNGEESIDDYC